MVAMPSSPLYDRLTKVAHLDYSDTDAETISKIKSQISALKEACATFTGNTGVQGATNDAMSAWVSEFQDKLATLETRLQNVNAAHTEARGAMTTAKDTHGTLSPLLLHASDYKAARMFAGGEPNAAQLEREYLENLAIQRNAQREAAAQAALDTMNGAVSSASAGFSKQAAEGEPTSNGGGGSSGTGRPRGRHYPSQGGGFSPSSAGNAGGPIAGLTTLPSVSPSSSILAGVDVTTMPVGGHMTADGPTSAHIPAPVTDANDPRWRDDYNPFGDSSRSKSLGIAGGALTTGGALAGLGRLSSAASSVGSSMGGFASRAASSQFGTVPAGGQLAPSTTARLSSSNAISRVMHDFERGALTPRGTAQAGNWGNAARVTNSASAPSAAGRMGTGFPRGMGAPAMTGAGAGAAGSSAQAGASSNASTMSARARAAASIRPAGATGTTATGAPANGAAAGARGTASSATKGSASVKAGTSSQSAAASARSASASAARAGVGARPGVMGTTAGAASGSASTAKGSATKGASAKAASSAKTSSAGTGAARSASSNGNVSGGSSSAAARGASAATARGPIGAGAVAGAASKEEKDKAKRRALSGLKAVRVEGVEEKAPAAAGLSAGNAESLKPVAAADQDDRW